MAKVRSNLVVDGISGKVGDQLVFRHMRDGRTILARTPDFSKRKLSKEQETHHERFKQAAAYARVAARTQPIYAQLAKGTSKTAYNLALSDWFNPPVIHRVEMVNGVIRVLASDDVRVAGVKLTILDNEGKTLEQGEATSQTGDLWEYTPNHAGKAVIEARDLAGNSVRMEKSIGKNE